MATRKPAASKSSRGMVTAAGRSTAATLEPPVLVKRSLPPADPPEALYRYVSNADSGRFLHLKITTLAREDAAALAEKPRTETISEDEALTRAALAHEPGGYLFFHDYQYSTEYPSVARWLDDRIRRGLLLHVARDSAQMKVRCAYEDEDGQPCPYWVFNTRDGMAELAQHVIEDHDIDTAPAPAPAPEGDEA